MLLSHLSAGTLVRIKLILVKINQKNKLILVKSKPLLLSLPLGAVETLDKAEF